MADDVDMASDFIDRAVTNELSRIRQAAAKAVGSDFCLECGDDVPEVRKKLGFSLCVPCAEERERKQQLFA